MKHLRKGLLFLVLALPFIFSSCTKDDAPAPTVLNSKIYNLGAVGASGITGTATVIEKSDATLSIELQLKNTMAGGLHPAHIHLNNAAEGGDIALTLKAVDGATGKSTTTFKALDNGSAITYQQLLAFDGYINVHLAADKLSTLVAQGDIGQNVLTGASKVYPLGSVAVPSISGTATFFKRENGEALAVVKLNNTPAGGVHPGHIHLNTAAETGGIAFTFMPVNGDTGMSTTNVSKLDNGTAFGYDQVLAFNGYINFHLSSTALSTLVAQGDIGQNALTGVSKVYPLGSVAVASISGTATFFKRENGGALAVVKLNNTPAGGVHPGHIHLNTAAQTGGIAFTFKPVNGDTGMSTTNVSKLDNGTAFGYDQVLAFNGYINFHLSATALATLVAQGDIGQNELTGKKVSYILNQKDVAGINGTVEFAERVNQTTLVTIKLVGTSAGASHPAHIHENTAAGTIIAGLNSVNGDTGISKTQVASLVGGATITYTQLLAVNAYVNAHLSSTAMSTLVAQGSIGLAAAGGAATPEAKTYAVTNNGSTAYIFNGEGLTNASNANFTFKRGGTYTFNVTAPGHPFYINSVSGLGASNAYNSGVTGNGAVSGAVKFTVPANAPNTLFYNCEFHGSMAGTITITN
jgi:protein tyrosine phosphatase (PTP) superfamily phosphohydrolase (DUF442 family)